MDSFTITRKKSTFTISQRFQRKLCIMFEQDELKIWKVNQKTLLDELNKEKINETFLWDILGNEFFFDTLIQLRPSMKITLFDYDNVFVRMEVVDHYKNYKVKLSDYYINKIKPEL